MSDLIQITTPAPPRDYASNSQHNRQNTIQQNPTGQVFDLGDQTQIVKTNDRTRDNAQQNLKDSDGSVLLRAPSNTVKSPAAALNAAKELISREAIALIRETGSAETLNKVTEFAAEVMQTPETIVSDMISQQKNATIYGDKLWNILKSLITMTDSKEFESGVADFARAAADLAAKDEILKSLSANFRYLAGEAAPGKAVADELNAAANALSGAEAADNFTAIKSTLLKLLGYTEHSLLLNDDTKNLLPLIVHTMSRYNDNPESLGGSFDSLLKLSENLTLSPEQLELLGLDGSKSLAENLSALFDKFIKANEFLSPEAKQSALLDSGVAQHEAELQSSVNLLAAGAKHMASRISGETLMQNLGTIDYSKGSEALRLVLGSVIPNTPAMRNALQSLFDELEQTGDLDSMITRLNTILENIGEDNENTIRLAQGLNSALSEMAASGKYEVSTSTAMETLTDFISKNINNSFLHSLSGLNRSDLVNNMLTAPGIFAPLLHHFVPLEAFGKRAFGEMWIDPNADELENVKGRGESDGSGSHMFLCFDIEDTGYFELEIYEKDRNLSVMLLCPENLENAFSSIRSVIPKIATENGYRVTASIVEGMKNRRTLDQVFPKLTEKRSSLNMKI